MWRAVGFRDLLYPYDLTGFPWHRGFPASASPRLLPPAFRADGQSVKQRNRKTLA
jgi:hypothetical protein